MDQTQQLLQELTEAHGVPGYEVEIRTLVRNYLEPLGSIEHDSLGSVICRKGEDGPRVMLAGHMDEIGFMVSYITDEGFLRYLKRQFADDAAVVGEYFRNDIRPVIFQGPDIRQVVFVAVAYP